MPRRNGVRRAKGGRSRRPVGSNPPSSALVYTGPVNIGPSTANAKSSRTITKTFKQAFEIITSGAGVISGNINFGLPNTLSGWSEEITTWDEYRILGIAGKWMPYNRYNQVLSAAGSVVMPLLAICLDRDSVAGSPAFADIMEYEGVVMGCLGDVFSLPIYKMNGPQEAEWLTTATSGPSRGLLFASGPTNSSLLTTKVGVFCVDWTVQFRGTQ